MSASSPSDAPEEPHCKGCGASLWFETESWIHGLCINCYWDNRDEDREWHLNLDRVVHGRQLIEEMERDSRS